MNSGYCDRCKNYFRYVDYNQCSYHSSSTVTNGIYACCGKQSNGFSLFLNQYQSFENGGGCQNGDHVLDDASEQLTKLNKSESLLKLIKQQQTMKQLPDTAIKQNFLFQVIEQSLYTNNTLTNSSSLITLNTPNTMTMVGMIGKKPSRSLWTYLIDTNPFGPNLKYQWDACKSTRWNQDTQREDEHRRNDVMLRYIQNEQMAKSTINRNVQTKDLSLSNTNTPSVNFPGGFYCRIENDWRMRTSNTTTANNSNKDSPNSSLLNLKNRQRLLK
ncbi:unnamed protein product [Didymodactylos carnosus]|uniref:Uncharacterized protein n=1 Tax=Didymodactylos carnosus TaxID=1234261 RepID=A0A813PQP5_9BILA|nr:unnamed protein product [Didymodactylos carnosus]CAF0754449.1 unnamed protein product [Didymodactylos carnosus]CAF3519742.1 unnamed protein product [Didymodactylos carnosus]CAF3534620.1 unnamed protein product [Didymodactylos carnosus]